MLPSIPTILTTTLITLLSSPVLAVDSSELCVNNTLLYSPFTPWFKAWPNVTSGFGISDSHSVHNLACWWYADCSFAQAPDVRKQQYSATALVMGLIPLILKDIAWPQRRIAAVPRQQPWYIETVVRALGLNPTVTSEKIKYGLRFQKSWQSNVLLVVLVFDLLVAYGALVVIELYSKRSSLGCPAPAFIALWFIAAIVPSVIEVGATRYQDRNKKDDSLPSSIEQQSEGFEESDNTAKVTLSVVAPADSVPGGDQVWIVQVFWAFYYSAGTLIFSSIMLVTVVELVVWVLAASVATAASKMLGYKLCGYWGHGMEG